MHRATRAAFGIALMVSSIAGCSVIRRDSGNPQWQPAGAVTSYSVGPSVGPDRTNGHSSRIKQNDFAFSHPRVDDFVTRFQTDLRGFYGRALERSGRYVPRVSSILEKEGLPKELAYLPLIESGYRPHAVSRARAVGLWQLIPGTGRRYGLRIDRYVDERRDPVKSTRAAAHYLKDLYAMFGDWHLSLAAYNTGEGNISRILEQGRADDFWEMSDRGFLYQETEDFVPEFLAALHIAEEPEAYGFEVPDQETLQYDLVNIKRPLPLSTVARLTGSSVDEIKDLNPALHRGVIPPQGYSVRLPKGTKDTFEVAYASLPVRSAVRASKARGKHATGKRVTLKRRAKGGAAAAAIAKPRTAAAKASKVSKTRSRHARPRAAVVAARDKTRSRAVD